MNVNKTVMGLTLKKVNILLEYRHYSFQENYKLAQEIYFKAYFQVWKSM